MSAPDPVENILGRLQHVKKNGHGWVARCPSHDDRNPSLSITTGNDGRALIFCHAGCTADSVLGQLGLSARDLFSATSSSGKGNQSDRGEPTATYDYKDEHGAVVYQVVRYDAPSNTSDGKKQKTFVARRPDGHGGWMWSLNGTPRLLYRTPEVVEAPPDTTIFVAEGEKDVDSLFSIGCIGTTSPFGAGKWDRVSNSTILHDRPVVIIPDNDNAGRSHADQVARSLHGKASEVRMLELPNGSKDFTEWLSLVSAANTFSQSARSPLAEFVEMAKNARVYTPKALPEAATESGSEPDFLTDLGNAARLVKMFGEDLRFCGQTGKWLIWDGTRWRADDSLRVTKYGKQAVLSLYDDAKAESDLGKQERLFKHALHSQKRERLNAMVDLSRSDLPIHADELDSDPMVLNVLNGTIDLRTGELRPHRREDYISKIAPVVYDPAAICSRWLLFLDEITESDPLLKRFLRKYIGYCLTGDVIEQLFILFFGDGANGKSVFLDTILAILGDYSGEAPPDLLVQRRNEEHPTEIADLCGKRLVVGSETEAGANLRVQLIKRMTGNQYLKGRYMRCDYFQFKRTHKLILATNNRPTIHEPSHAIWRRVLLVPFTVVIPDGRQDKALTQKLKDEWPGILAWAVRGCLLWQEEGMTPPACIVKATEEYRKEQDTISEFIISRCSFTPDAFVSREELYKAYLRWSEEYGERFPHTNVTLFEAVRKLRGVADERKRCKGAIARGFKGIELAVTACDRAAGYIPD